MIGIVFCTNKIFFMDQILDCKNLRIQTNDTTYQFNNSFYYNLVINATYYEPNKYDTSSYPMPLDLNAMTLKLLIDNAIILYSKNQTDFKNESIPMMFLK